MRPIFAARIHEGHFESSGKRFWWEANLLLEDKAIADCSMPGLALTHDSAKMDAERIAQIFNAEFVDLTRR